MSAQDVLNLYLASYIVKDVDLYMVTIYDDDPNKIHYYWTNFKNEYSRELGPALIIQWNDGVTEKLWMLNEEIHRIDGPANVIIYPDGSFVELWLIHGKKHRVGKPAKIYRDKHGGKLKEEWWYNDRPVYKLS
jgi:hypothetical protein